MKNSYYIWLKTQIKTYVTILFMYIIVNKGKSPSIKTCNIKHGVAIHLPPPPYPHPLQFLMYVYTIAMCITML